MASIIDFKNNIKNGFARPNLFYVTIDPPIIEMKKNDIIPKLRFNCHTIQVPGLTIATTDKDMGYRSIAYQKLYEDITLSFYCSENMQELEFFQNWLRYIAPEQSNRMNFYDKYVGKVTIQQLARDNSSTLTTIMHEAYPKKIDSSSLDYNSNSSLMSIGITLTYRYYTQNFEEAKKIDEIVSEETSGAMYAHTVDTEGNKVNIMNSITDKQQNWKMRGVSGSEEGFDLEF